MALLFQDGFDLYADTNDLQAAGGWGISSSGTSTVSTTEGRYGGGALKGNNNSAGFGLGLEHPLGATRIYCFAHRFNTPGASGDNNIIRGIHANGTVIWNITANENGDVKVFDVNNTQIGSTLSGAITAGAFYFFEVKVLLATTTSANDGAINIRINGSLVYSQTGMDLAGSGTNPGTFVLFHSGTSRVVDWWVDDMIVMDTSGSRMNDFIGDCRIDTLSPNAAGSDTAWTGAYTDVDDTPNSTDGDSTYIASSTAGQKESFSFPALSIVPDFIYAACPRARARKTDGGVRTYRAYVNSTGDVTNGATIGLLTDYAWDRLGAFYEDPDTATLWTRSGLDAASFGLEIVA